MTLSLELFLTLRSRGKQHLPRWLLLVTVVACCCWCLRFDCGKLWKGYDKMSSLTIADMALVVKGCVFMPQKHTKWGLCPLLLWALWHQKYWREILLNLAGLLVAQNMLQELLQHRIEMTSLLNWLDILQGKRNNRMSSPWCICCLTQGNGPVWLHHLLIQ